MKITHIETLHGDGGYRVCSYMKVSTDEGIVGWAEYYEGLTGASVTPLIKDFTAATRCRRCARACPRGAACHSV